MKSLNRWVAALAVGAALVFAPALDAATLVKKPTSAKLAIKAPVKVVAHSPLRPIAGKTPVKTPAKTPVKATVKTIATAKTSAKTPAKTVTHLVKTPIHATAKTAKVVVKALPKSKVLAKGKTKILAKSKAKTPALSIKKAPVAAKKTTITTIKAKPTVTTARHSSVI